MFVEEYKGISLSTLFARCVIAFMTESTKCSDSLLSDLFFTSAQSKASPELCWFSSDDLLIKRTPRVKRRSSTAHGLLFTFHVDVQKAKEEYLSSFSLHTHTSSTYDRCLEKQLFFSFHLLSLSCVLFTRKKDESPKRNFPQKEKFISLFFRFYAIDLCRFSLIRAL